MSEPAPSASSGWLRWAPRAVVGLAFAAQAALLVFVVVHNYVSPGVALGSDIAPLWLGGSVWRTLGPSHGYDAAAQSALYAQLTGGHGLDIPEHVGARVDADRHPALAVVAGHRVPRLDPSAAGRPWAAATIAATVAAPRSSVWFRAAAAMGTGASAGTVAVALYGQWDGIPALGVAVAYALWSRGHEGRAALVLTVLLLSGKPHLALGLLAFVIGRGSRRGLAGIAAGVLLTAVVDMALVQLTGMRGWVDALGQISTLFATASLSLFGLFANSVGGGVVVEAVAVAGAIALLVCGGAFGWLSSRGAPLHVCLLGATCVSLLVSPHMFAQDLALLLPARPRRCRSPCPERVSLTSSSRSVRSVCCRWPRNIRSSRWGRCVPTCWSRSSFWP